MHQLLLRRLIVCLTALLTASAGAQQPALVSVDAIIEQQFTQTVPVLGRLVAKQSGKVATRTDGAIAEVLVDPGDRVEQGQVLATIDASAQLLRKQLVDSQLVEAQARLKTAKAQLALATQEVERLGSLKGSAAVSEAVYDDARQQQNIAFARASEAEAAINSSRASLRLSELELEHTRIVAPFSGTVTRKLTEVGNYLKQGETILELISDHDLELEADIPSSLLAGLIPTTQVALQLDNGSEHSAVVRAIIPEENPRTRTRRVRFDTRLGSDAGVLASEQSATVLVPLSDHRTVISVHKDAIIRRGPDSLVYVVVDGHAQMTPIVTGQSIDHRIEILQGLAVGDQVVVRGNERLAPGQPVQTQ